MAKLVGTLDFETHSQSVLSSCCLLMIFVNSLDPDQARQNTAHDLDPSRFTL